MPTPLSDFEITDLSEYEIRSRREIIAILRHLIASKQLVQLQLRDMPGSVVTSLIELDEDTDSIIIDCAPESLVNQRIISSQHLAFETILDNIRILFEVGGAETYQYENAPALRIAIPAMLIRLQRREFYRVPTPVVSPILCRLPIDTNDNPRMLELPLHNISAGGVSLMDDRKLLNVNPGFIYQQCQITLPAGAKIECSMEIRNIREIVLANAKITRRIGCRFVNLPSSMLNTVQRYITNLEREQNAKSPGTS
ncbi:MAG: flagellar brake protein [Herbaspirillum sp.]